MVDAPTIAIACVLAIALTGCAATPTPSTPKRVVIAGQAKLDSTTGSISLPLDSYYGKSGVDTFNARNLAYGDCMIAEGYDQKIPVFTDTGSKYDQRTFGLWNEAMAAQYGYDEPRDPQDTPEQPTGKEPSEKEEASHDVCDAKTKDLFPIPDNWAENSIERLGYEALGQTARDPAAKNLVTVWEKCMLARGVKVKIKETEHLTVPVDRETMPLEQQIQTAVHEVQCKNDNNIVQQLADIDASYEVLLIAKHQTSLNKDLAMSQKTDKAVEKFLGNRGGANRG